ncbi:MAG: alpha/beta fold hydrolase [Coriobacteriales bacterium]|nr:alpha/beta fold hydrolase [Coriobacteriales bacterium]
MATQSPAHSAQSTSAKRIHPLRIISIIAVILLLLFCVVSLVVDYLILSQSFTRSYVPNRSTITRYEDFSDSYAREPLTFMSGENMLQGYLYMSKTGDTSTVKGLIVFCHGIGSWHQDYLAILLKLVDDGWLVFGYDATGSGESEGATVGSMSQSALDAHAALNFIEAQDRFAQMPVFVIGHSWGGYAAAAVLNFNHNIQGVVSLSGYSEPMGIIMEQAVSSMGSLVQVEYPFIWCANRFIAGDKCDLSAVAGINSCTTPVLVVHAAHDKVISATGAAIYAQQNRITNPNVSYYLFTDEGRDGHNSYFISESAHAYIVQKQEELYALCDEYDPDRDGVASDPAKQAEYDTLLDEFYAGINKSQANVPNPELISLLCDFLNSNLS